MTYDAQRLGLNDLACLKPGHGYWVKLANANTLTYPTSGYSCQTIVPLPKVVNLTNVVQPTPWVCDFWSFGTADGPSKGSILTVLDEQKTVCGQAVVLDGGMFLVHVYGDDPNTEVDEGAADGSKLTFTAGDAVYEITGSDEWTNRGSFEISLSRSGNNALVPNTFELSQNYPNPFNPNTTIRFRLPENMGVKLTIYNVLGQKVRKLIDGMLPSGEHEVEWDGTYDSGERAESGVYFYRISTEAFTDVRKMTLLK